MEVQLSDGTVMELPDDATPDAIRNFAQRGEQFVKQRGMDKGYGNEAVNVASAGLTGLNRGVADGLGAPVDGVNWLMRKAGLPVSDKPALGSDWIKDRMSDVNAVQPTRGHDEVAHYGELVGNGVTTAAMGGAVAPMLQAGGKAAAVAEALGPGKSLTGTMASQTTGAALQDAGEHAGQAVGGDVGRVIGGIAAPLAPTLALRGGERALQWALERPNGESGRAFDVLQENGITPSPGLVGNGTAARMENAASYLPGGMGDRNMMQTWEQFQNRLQQLRGEVAGAHDPVTDLPGADTVGARARDVAASGLARTTQNVGGQYDQLRAEFGAQRLVPVHDALEQIRGMGETTVNGQDRPRVEPGMQSGLDSEVSRIDALRVPKSETAQGLLTTEIRARQEMLADPRLRPNARAQLQQELDALQTRYEQNRQVPAEALDTALTKIGYDAQGNPTIDTGQTKQVKGALGQARSDAYASQGQGLADRLHSLDQHYANLMDKTAPRAEGGDIPYLRRLTDTPNDIDVFNQVADPKRWDNANVVQRNAPTQWGPLASSIMGEKSALPPGKRGPIINSTPGEFAKWWGSLPSSGKIMFANGSEETLSKLNSLYEAAQQYGLRSGTMNFSNTAPSAATATFMGSVLSHPINTAKALGSSMLMGGMATSPRTARVIAGRVSPLVDRLMGPASQAGMRELEAGGRQ